MRDRDHHHSESGHSVSKSLLICFARKEIVKMAAAVNAKQLVVKNHEELIQRFKCGLCNQNLRPPIRMCKDGHNFCDICKTGSECALCSVPIMEENRNMELENIAVVIYYQ